MIWPKQSVCCTNTRIEAVFMLQGHIPLHLETRDFFDPPALHHLLKQTPMLLLFSDNDHRLGLRHIIQPVTTHLTCTLKTITLKRVLQLFNWNWALKNRLSGCSEQTPTADEEPRVPGPVTRWINDHVQRMRIERIFPFSDTLRAGPRVGPPL